MITLIQVVIIVFVLFAWSRVFLRYRKNDMSLGEFIFWSCIWIATLVIAAFPTTFNFVSQLLGTYSILNSAVYVSIILLLYLVYRLYAKFGEQQKEITKLVREVSIKDAKKKK